MTLYKELNLWAQTLPPKACYPSVRVPEYHFFRYGVLPHGNLNPGLHADESQHSATYHLYALVLFRPLSGLDLKIEAPISRPEDFCMNACTHILSELDYWENAHPCSSAHGSVTTLWFYFFTTFTLITHLGSNPASHRPFTQACLKMKSFIPYWPVVSILLSGIHAFAQQLRAQLPPETLACFLGVDKNLPRDADGDVPVTWALPQHNDLLELLADDDYGDDSESQQLSPVGMGLVIAKWNKLTLGG
jgi:hypothetical protein